MADNKSFTEENIEALKNALKERMNLDPVVTIEVNQKRHQMINAKSTITGVYNRFITVNSNVNGYNETFSINLIDLFMGQYVIKEIKLENILTESN